MSTEKIKNILKNTKYPDFILKTAKEKLKKDLLSEAELVLSKDKKKTLFKYFLSTAASIIFVLFLIFQIIPQQVSAKEIAHNLEKTYLNSLIKNSVYYIKKLFTVKGKENTTLLMESWRYNKNLLRLQFKDENDGKIISHLIATNKRTYELKETNSRLKLKIKIDICEKDGEGSHKNITKNENIKVIIKKLKNIKNEGKRSKVLIIKESPDMIDYCKQIPNDIYDKLKSNKNVKYLGKKINEATGNQMDVFEKISYLDSTFFILEYEDDLNEKMEWFLNKIRDKKIKLNSKNKSDNLPEAVSNKKLKAIETTQIDKTTGKIIRMSYKLLDDSEIVHQYELDFIEYKFLKYDSSIFDPELYNLK